MPKYALGVFLSSVQALRMLSAMSPVCETSKSEIWDPWQGGGSISLQPKFRIQTGSTDFDVLGI